MTTRLHAGLAIAAYVLGVACFGCSTGTKVVSDALPVLQIPAGTAVSDIERIVGRPCPFQFIVERDGTQYECVEYYSRARLYMILKDGGLDRLVEAPPAPSVVCELTDGDLFHISKPGFVPQHIEETLAAPRLSGEQLSRWIRTETAPEAPISPFNNLGPAKCLATLLALVCPQGRADARARLEQFEQTQREYDPRRVKPNMTRQDVDAVFGHPIHIAEINNNSGYIAVYGKVAYRSTRVGVHFEAENVVGVYQNNCFDEFWSPGFSDRVVKIRNEE